MEILKRKSGEMDYDKISEGNILVRIGDTDFRLSEDSGCLIINKTDNSGHSSRITIIPQRNSSILII